MFPAVAPASPQSWSMLLGVKPQHAEASLPPGQQKWECSELCPDWLQAAAFAEISGEKSSRDAGNGCLQNESGTHSSSWLPSKCWVSGCWEGFVLWFGIIKSRTILRSAWSLRLLPRKGTYYEPGLIPHLHFLDDKTDMKRKSLPHVAQLGNIRASFESSAPGSPEIPLSHPMGHLQIQRESRFWFSCCTLTIHLNFSQKETSWL